MIRVSQRIRNRITNKLATRGVTKRALGCRTDIITLKDLGLKVVERRLCVHDSRTYDGRYAQHHAAMIPDAELGGQAGNVARKKAVRHRGVEQHGHDPAVQTIGVSLENGVAVELRHNASVGLPFKTQPQAIRAIAAANQTTRMTLMAQVSGHRHCHRLPAFLTDRPQRSCLGLHPAPPR